MGRGLHAMMIATMLVAVSLVLVVLTAAMRGEGVAYAYAHMAVCAASSLALAWDGWRHTAAEVRAGAADRRVASVLARGMSVIWFWGLVCLIATYATDIVQWREWGRFAIAFGVAGVLAGVMSRLLAADDRDDARLQAMARYTGIVQLVGMIIVMLGLVIDGKMARFLEVQRVPWQDWAANNYFFFGALALALLSAYGLKTTKPAGAARAS